MHFIITTISKHLYWHNASKFQSLILLQLKFFLKCKPSGNIKAAQLHSSFVKKNKQTNKTNLVKRNCKTLWILVKIDNTNLKIQTEAFCEDLGNHCPQVFLPGYNPLSPFQSPVELLKWYEIVKVEISVSQIKKLYSYHWGTPELRQPPLIHFWIGIV